MRSNSIYAFVFEQIQSSLLKKKTLKMVILVEEE